MHVLIVMLALCGADAEAEPKPVAAEAAVDFVRDVQPIFAKHCHQCHGADEQESGLRLDVRDKALAGGDGGEVILPKNSGESELFARITEEDDDLAMPPDGKRLSDKEVAVVKDWIDQGAVWPDSAAGAVKTTSDHWAFQTPTRPELPMVESQSWVRNPIDAFVLAKLEAERISPAPAADKHTLMRRLYLDLLGLLPTPAEMDEYLNDSSPDAYEKLVDRLLASPHFGERWGRHWLDIARYADSNGYERDDVRPHAWRYRDWVIESFNRDQPYDQFVIEQLAGDLLPEATIAQKAATGFHRMTLTNTESGINKEDYRNREVVDRVNTTGTALLGISIGCAQCHSHKYDPLTQKEYYQFYAFFNNADETDLDLEMTPQEAEEFAAKEAAHNAKKARLQAEQGALKSLLAAKENWEAALAPEVVKPLDLPADLWRALVLGPARRTLAEQVLVDEFHASLEGREQAVSTDLKTLAVEARYIKKPYLMTLSQRTDEVRTTHVLLRGDFKQPGAEVKPTTPEVFPAFAPRGETADRLDLARWIVSPENPLTARVAVNQIWQHLFGRGLVTTVDDFGTQGALPSHPQLLDWLAVEFVENGWSRKQLIKQIVMSATYRQSSKARPQVDERDPDNALLARQSRFRVAGEIVRDIYLTACGKLCRKVGGPTIRPPLPESVINLGFKYRTIWETSRGEDQYRRGLYIHFKRSNPFPSLMTFDCPEATVTNVERNRSNTPLQALTTLNDPLFVETAQALGQRLLREEPTDDTARVQLAGRLCLNRELSSAETDVLLDVHQTERAAFAERPKLAEQFIGDYAIPDVPTVETAAWIAVARTVMNLDEFITRE